MRVIVLVSIGLGLIVGGLYWHVWDDSTEFIEDFIVPGSYSDTVQLFWNLIPIILLVLGVICLVMGGKGSSRREVYE